MTAFLSHSSPPQPWQKRAKRGFIHGLSACRIYLIRFSFTSGLVFSLSFAQKGAIDAAYAEGVVQQATPALNISSSKVALPLPQKDLIKTVLTAALDFMMPRMLSLYTPRDLCLWGLSGLSTIDPSLNLRQEQSEKATILVLTYNDAIIARQTMPPAQNTDKTDYNEAWAALSTAIIESAWQHSVALQDLRSGSLHTDH